MLVGRTSDYRLSLAENKEILDHERTAPERDSGSHWDAYLKKEGRKITFLPVHEHT